MSLIKEFLSDPKKVKMASMVMHGASAGLLIGGVALAAPLAVAPALATYGACALGMAGVQVAREKMVEKSRQMQKQSISPKL